MAKRSALAASLAWLKKLDWSYLLVWLLAIAAAVLLQIFRLSSLTGHHLSAAEQNTLLASNNWHEMITNPLFLPYKALEWLLVLAFGRHIFVIRLTSVIFALISLWLFLAIARRWFNKITYIFTTVLFGSSLWLLHFGRLAVPTIMLTIVPLALIRLVLWLREIKAAKSNKYLIALVVATVLALSLYVPGAWSLWFALIVWQRKKVKLLAQKLPGIALLGGIAIGLILLAPLIYGLVLEPSQIKAWLGYASATNGLRATVRLFVDWPVYLLGYGPQLPANFWLARQPLLGIFSGLMTLVGVFFYVKNHELRQARLVGLLLIVSLAMFALSDRALLGFASGLIFLLVGVGIGYLLQIWKQVFPKNPLAFGLAVGILGIAVALSVIYSTRSYFDAWRYHPVTSQAFTIKI